MNTLSENEPKQSQEPQPAGAGDNKDVEFPKQQWLCCNKVCAEKFSYDADQIFWYPEDKKWLCAECLKELGLSADNRMTLEVYFQRRMEQEDGRYSEPAYRERRRIRSTATIVSDRDDLMRMAVQMFSSFQHRQSVAHQQMNMEPAIELVGQEAEAYNAAMKYLTDEFKKGTTPTKHFTHHKEDFFSDPV